MRVQCVWSNMSISNRPLQPPSNINLFILIIIIILNDPDHHTSFARDCNRERERERERDVNVVHNNQHALITVR